MKYRILSLDGGGVRGIFTARILARLVELQSDLIDGNVDLIAGTSTGAIIAVLLASGKTPGEIVNLYRQNSRIIFNNNLAHDVGDLFGIIGAKYTTTDRMNGIYPAIGDVRLSELRHKVLIPTFKLDSVDSPQEPAAGIHRWKAEFFHNLPGPNPFLEERAIDVVLRSSAAPTYFPIYQGYIDGGVVANNPCMCALAQALNQEFGQHALSDIVLLSIGSGCKPQAITSQNGNWGLQQWGFKIIDLLLEADIGLSDYQCRQLLGTQYHRVDVTLPQEIPMDAWHRAEDLLTLADNLSLSATSEWLLENWLQEPDRIAS